MKSTARYFYSRCFATTALSLLAAAAHAEVHFELNFGHAYGDYYATVELSATNPVPITYHRVQSPSGLIWKQTDDTGSSAGDTWTNDFYGLLDECTNGLWSLILNVGDAAEEVYQFAVSASDLTTNTFGDVVIISPPEGSTITNNPPTIEWSGPSHLPALFVMVRDDAYNNFEYIRPDSSETSWTPGITLTEGPNSVLINYEDHAYQEMATSTPTNTAGGAALPDWQTKFGLACYAYGNFTVTSPAVPPASLGKALDAVYLPWRTGGNTDWFAQSSDTHDGVDAAQSGPVGFEESSWVETTVNNDGILEFWWKIDGDWDDYLELQVNGEQYATFYDDGDWQPFEDYIEAGTTLRWTFYNADDTGGGQDTAFLDQVGFGTPLAMAVDAPELVWTTGGQQDWFEEYDETSDGWDAAQSGYVDLYGESWIETTAIGPGTLSFSWGIFADENDYLVFEFNGIPWEFLYWDRGWDTYEIELDPGPNTLRWTFRNFDDTGGGLYDAGFLDEVVYTPSVTASDYEAEMTMSIQRNIRGSNETYTVNIFFSDYAPVTSDIEVESANGMLSGELWSSSSVAFPSLQEAIAECEAGPWTIYFDRGTPEEKQFTFDVTIPILSTNDMPPVVILSPPEGAAGVSPDPDYQWVGPATYSYISANLFDMENKTYLGFSSLVVTETTWTNAPTAPEGTNQLSVSYTLNGYPGILVSDPVDSGSSPLNAWTVSTDLVSLGESRFVVVGTTPLPVTILPPVLIGGDLGLSFISQSGATHLVEYSTNLVTGSWLPATNFTGDGTAKMLTLPTTKPAAFYRIQTQ